MRRALTEAMRARDRNAVNALRATLAAVDNVEAVPLDEVELSAVADGPVRAGTTEVARRELDDEAVAGIVRAEADERLAAAAQLSAAAQEDRAARLRAEADVLAGLL
ncbi:hypothetical protein FHU35_1377 [Saccharopolyspora dendranthemae]|uniref:GatB/YqeY domain-containing protein n=2 Tax=Saccharopolyspora dendranthemae TaxID=1181886 RepID=A0A561U4U9_9PSEU|nr:hypothetical protein FHU35_1377 [Saccharopolyspora dendranthemae]